MANDKDGPLKPITQAELDEVLRKHAMFRAARMGGIRAALNYRDMRGLNFRGADLAHADFTGASLYQADMRDTKLDYVVMFGTDMRFSNMQSASLVRADMRGVCLRGAFLVGTDLTGVDLREGVLNITDSKGNLTTVHKDIDLSGGGGRSQWRKPNQCASVGGCCLANQFQRRDNARL